MEALWGCSQEFDHRSVNEYHGEHLAELLVEVGKTAVPSLLPSSKFTAVSLTHLAW